MAESNQQACEEPRGQPSHGPSSVVLATIAIINRGLAAMSKAATRDGTLAAAFRQGAGEIGQALKAFPDSIQVHEPGTVLNPTQGEIAAARDTHATSHAPSPSDIARENAGTVHGPEQAHSPAAPSPSDIARSNGDTVHGQQQGSVQAPPSPSDIARGNGQVLTQEKSWQEREIEREKAKQEGNGENDQNERAKGRSLPDEQREKEKEDRGRGR